VYKTVDKGILEFLGPAKANTIFSSISISLTKVQGYSLQVYLCIGYLIIITTLFFFDIFEIINSYC